MGSRRGLGERVAGLVQGPFRNGRPLRLRAADYHSPQTSLRTRAHKDARGCPQDCDTGATSGSAGTRVRLKFVPVLTLSGRKSSLESEGMAMPSKTLRSEKLDLRLTRKAKTALRAAAAASNRSVSEFVLESALARADEALADRRTFGLNAAQWKAFLTALDAPPRPLPRLERLLKEPGFFDAGSSQ